MGFFKDRHTVLEGGVGAEAAVVEGGDRADNDCVVAVREGRMQELCRNRQETRQNVFKALHWSVAGLNQKYSKDSIN